MNKKILIIIFIVFLVGIVTASSVLFLFPYDPLSPPTVDDKDSTPDGIIDVVNANNKFAIDLYKELILSENENIFMSPYSIFSAIAMTYEGADGQTKQEMKDVFYFPEDNILRSNFAALYNQINKKNKQYILRTGNALWAQQDYPFIKEYISRVERYYGGKAVNLDFVTETEQSRQTINTFIEQQTNNRIKDLLPQGSITPLTALVLTNAIYFKGDWEFQFDKKDTRELPFYITKENIVQTPIMFMNPEENLNYLETTELQILELPYKNKELSMLILLPKKEVALEKIEQTLTYEQINEWQEKFRQRKVHEIYLPKFEFEHSNQLSKNLKHLGMVSAFGGAVFSRMSEINDLVISEVIHKAFIKVDEEGSEAAAATAVIMESTSVNLDRIIFNANRPFIFMIKENQTNSILFLGRMVNPSS